MTIADRIESLLRNGLTCDEVVRKLQCNRQYVYEVVERRALFHNTPIIPGSPREQALAVAIWNRGFLPEEICVVFDAFPAYLVRVYNRSQKNQEGIHHPYRLTREEAPSHSGEPRGTGRPPGPYGPEIHHRVPAQIEGSTL